MWYYIHFTLGPTQQQQLVAYCNNSRADSYFFFQTWLHYSFGLVESGDVGGHHVIISRLKGGAKTLYSFAQATVSSVLRMTAKYFAGEERGQEKSFTSTTSHFYSNNASLTAHAIYNLQLEATTVLQLRVAQRLRDRETSRHLSKKREGEVDEGKIKYYHH